MCEMKSSCPVPRGSVQHTEQGLGLGRGLQGVAWPRGSPALHMDPDWGGCSAAWDCAIPAGEAGGGLLSWDWWVAAKGQEAVGGTALLNQALAAPPHPETPQPHVPTLPPCLLVSRCFTEIIKSAISAGSASPARLICNQC